MTPHEKDIEMIRHALDTCNGDAFIAALEALDRIAQPAAQKTEGAGEYSAIKTQKDFDGKTFNVVGGVYMSIEDIALTVLDNCYPQPISTDLASRASVDVEALKREIAEMLARKWRLQKGLSQHGQDYISETIDHLVATGRLHASHTGGKTE